MAGRLLARQQRRRPAASVQGLGRRGRQRDGGAPCAVAPCLKQCRRHPATNALRSHHQVPLLLVPNQIIVLILSQDKSFSHNIHKITLNSGG
jgi:hypothetical protein